MHYHLEYEICALVFLIIITIKYFEVRHFPGRLNKLFGVILFFAIADLALDIFGSYTIVHANSVAPWINYVVNTTFYSLQVVFLALMTSFVIIMIGLHFLRQKFLMLLMIPVAVYELMILLNPITKSIFYIGDVGGVLTYIHGPWFKALYLCGAFYLLVTFVLSVAYRKKLQKKEFTTIICFILVVATAMLLQFTFPDVLLTGVAIAIAILIMFFTMQNPESMLDSISGVFNYSSLMLFLHTQIDEGREMWLIAADVGGIRRINSDYGVRVGNNLIFKIGDFFNSLTKGNACAFHMSGTRFLILANNENTYRNILEKLENRFSTPWNTDSLELSVGITIRYFEEQGFFKTPDEIINLIDITYSQMTFDEWGITRSIGNDLLAKAQRQIKVENAIRQALGSGEGFLLNFQPMFCVSEGKYTGAEVLLRLNSPEMGFISPAEFIPVAEKTGLICPIDNLVISKTNNFILRHPELKELGLKHLHINLSAMEFSKDLDGLIDSIVSTNAVSPEMLCFEVTETAAVIHRHILESFMQKMIGFGYRFALDDFGTGYANISLLAQLPFSMVKLDRSLLVSDMETERILFEDLLRMFRRMNLKTVVEGVETHEQAQRTSQLGADHIQGYFFCRPLPESEFMDFIQAQYQPDA